MQILLREGAEAAVGTPAAVLAEPDAAPQAPPASSSSSQQQRQQDVQQGAAYAAGPAQPRVPTTDVYDDAQPRVRVLEWQSYLKQGTHGTSSCGCS